ncbi:MAG: polyphosphate kinase 2 family protein [Acidimicrobiia bacterium]|nr:polyphosphate kinase 2 family protein [Acidimicrobiia bacterium]
METDRYRVTPGSAVDLSAWDPNDNQLFPAGKKESKAALRELREQLAELQRLLWAESKHKVLVVLQAMDSGGKDGTIRHVFRGVNPQGVKVAGFKKPTPEELAHDYLWRVHDHTPAAGEIVIFNRSHYEDVLVVRVHDIVPEEQWSRRYDHINEFERLLADEGTTIVKFYLHIDLDEQKERFQARLDEPESRWKFRAGDLDDRELWPDFMEAYEAALGKTSTAYAPWYVIPANRKWYRNLVISRVLIDTLGGLDMSYPEPEQGLDDIVIT